MPANQTLSSRDILATFERMNLATEAERHAFASGFGFDVPTAESRATWETFLSPNSEPLQERVNADARMERTPQRD